MNYYEHHIGDYAKDAGHLSMVEDGAYRRLIDAYYSREQPLPSAFRDCCKLARAITKAERDAVTYVLREFFTLQDDGYHQKRCDEEVARYHEKEPDREAKRENERIRQRRHRERRKELFDLLREQGELPKFDAKTEDLERLLSRVTRRDIDRDTSRNVTTVTCDATATQTPDTSNQSRAKARAEEREKPTAPDESLPDDPPAPPASPPPAKTPKRGLMKLDTWLATLGDADAIPADDPIFGYARQTGIPVDFLELSWLRFCEDMRQRGKLQRDWRAHYRNAVRSNWFKLWWFAPDGSCQLTTTGEQARRAAA